ncbi:helix-turn-helix domain-containing protein [Bartonella henselae]|uniref:Transcriptional regulator n=1 Tax=Bartonella henselae (strain ATCC 49882 / DSM 28221 / CCUG 30454 / Houston 1) TaxID=283166 RepID=A0A0H3LYE0_BARHE|nr:helix-turn-helix transcriptional regulator [Bartonella henselae]ETS06047.1 hypothetical protein Q654_01409 [Bartonella henselae JK 50]ETS06136.1 hypothetical protein Q655_01359 [Bartonella henselae JK 51]CAF28188.1 Transcriptional regulator [Bartonella henselae str. Houston-1]CDO40746.1 transcriptional regulator [Bartonella henselae]CUH91320.1 transcriptional regulator [Bartonella henselae]
MQARNLHQAKNLHNDIFVGKKIRFRRKMLKMSQKTLADHLRVSSQQIQKYETGLNRVSAGRLKEIADRVKTFFDDLSGGFSIFLNASVSVRLSYPCHFFKEGRSTCFY